jgi:hypothetical protein
LLLLLQRSMLFYRTTILDSENSGFDAHQSDVQGWQATKI